MGERSTSCSSGRAPSSGRSSASRSRRPSCSRSRSTTTAGSGSRAATRSWMTTTGWLLGEAELPPTEIAYLWPAAQAPVTWATGPTYVQALPPLVLAQVLVLGPVALLCLYGIAARIGGRLLGYWASLLWVIAPFAAIPLFVDRYQERWTEHFLPQALGLTALADFPSMVLVLHGGPLRRALAFAGPNDGCRARGPAPGRSRGAQAAELPGRSRRRARLRRGASVARGARLWAQPPSLRFSSSSLWKVKGLGEIPAFALEQAHLAAGSLPLAADFRLDRYFELDFEHWRLQMDQLREFFWSARLAQWAPFAGLVAVLRDAALADRRTAGRLARSVPRREGLLDPRRHPGEHVLATAHAGVARVSAAVRIDPSARSDTCATARRSGPVLYRAQAWLHAGSWSPQLLTVVVPWRRHRGVDAARAAADQGGRPGLRGRRTSSPRSTTASSSASSERGPGPRLSWTDGGPWRADVFYRVYRHDGPGDDTRMRASAGVAIYCVIRGVSRSRRLETLTFVDESALASATYRIGVGTNWIDDPEEGDVFAFSPPVTVDG